jgi:hypothetical protein
MLMLIACEDVAMPDSARPARRRGATVLEYLFVLSLIGVACMVGIGYFGSETKNLTEGASNAINKSLSAAPGSNVLPAGGVMPAGSADATDQTTTTTTTTDKTKDKTKQTTP